MAYNIHSTEKVAIVFIMIVKMINDYLCIPLRRYVKNINMWDNFITPGAYHTYKWHIIMKYIAGTLEFHLDKFAL